MDFQQLKSTIHTNGAAVCELQFKNHANEAAAPLPVPTDREEMVTVHVQLPAEHAEEAAVRELQFKNFELQFKNHANEAAAPLTVPADREEMVTVHVQLTAEHGRMPAEREEMVADHEEMPAAPLTVVTDRAIRMVVSLCLPVSADRYSPRSVTIAAALGTSPAVSRKSVGSLNPGRLQSKL